MAAGAPAATTPPRGCFPQRPLASITHLLHQDSSADGGAAGNYSRRFQALISPGAAGARARRCRVAAFGQ